VIKICDLRPHQDVRFDGRDFRVHSTLNPDHPMVSQGPLSFWQVDVVLGELCARAEKLTRWQGRSNRYSRSISVAEHSLLVAWIVSQDHPEAARWAAAHDLGETLGLGDPAAPWLDLYPGLRVAHHEHQAAVDRLLGDCPPEISRAVHEADVAARSIETSYLEGGLGSSQPLVWTPNDHPAAETLFRLVTGRSAVVCTQGGQRVCGPLAPLLR